jgi:hypothetical protein
MNYTILKIKMGNMISENQIINQYKKIGFNSSNIIDTVNDINDFLFKRNSFWKNNHYDGENYYVIFTGNKERISYQITPYLYREWK